MDEGTYNRAGELHRSAKLAVEKGDRVEAVRLLNSALSLDPSNVDCLTDRAHIHTFNEDYDKAVEDAETAIAIARHNSIWEHVLPGAYLRHGVASFHLGRYRQARNSFVEGRKVADDSNFGQWIEWCDQKMKKLKEKTESGSSEVEVIQSQELPKEAAVSVAPVVNSLPIPKIKHDWYQTETQVVVEVRIKGLKNDLVKVEFGDTTLSVSAKLPNNEFGSEYSLELDLAHPVLKDQCTYKVLSTKLEIKMKKRDGYRWAALEGCGLDPLQINNSSATSAPVYPSSSGKNWDRIMVDVEEELKQDKPEGEQALNEMFQKIYADADDSTKKAMNKSFSESGGTVLSTNWADIGKQKTEIKPPDGMQFKRWDRNT